MSNGSPVGGNRSCISLSLGIAGSESVDKR